MPTETTTADRERELASLLDLIARQPERAWSEERRRVAVLQRMLARIEPRPNARASVARFAPAACAALTGLRSADHGPPSLATGRDDFMVEFREPNPVPPADRQGPWLARGHSCRTAQGSGLQVRRELSRHPPLVPQPRVASSGCATPRGRCTPPCRPA